MAQLADLLHLPKKVARWNPSLGTFLGIIHRCNFWPTFCSWTQGFPSVLYSWSNTSLKMSELDSFLVQLDCIPGVLEYFCTFVFSHLESTVKKQALFLSLWLLMCLWQKVRLSCDLMLWCPDTYIGPNTNACTSTCTQNTPPLGIYWYQSFIECVIVNISSEKTKNKNSLMFT